MSIWHDDDARGRPSDPFPHRRQGKRVGRPLVRAPSGTSRLFLQSRPGRSNGRACAKRRHACRSGPSAKTGEKAGSAAIHISSRVSSGAARPCLDSRPFCARRRSMDDRSARALRALPRLLDVLRVRIRYPAEWSSGFPQEYRDAAARSRAPHSTRFAAVLLVFESTARAARSALPRPQARAAGRKRGLKRAVLPHRRANSSCSSSGVRAAA